MGLKDGVNMEMEYLRAGRILKVLAMAVNAGLGTLSGH